MALWGTVQAPRMALGGLLSGEPWGMRCDLVGSQGHLAMMGVAGRGNL